VDCFSYPEVLGKIQYGPAPYPSHTPILVVGMSLQGRAKTEFMF